MLSLFLFTSLAFAGTNLHCDYVIMSTPFASVDLAFDDQGAPARTVRITNSGVSHTESATPEALAPGEFSHIWISKESPSNKVEMIVYRVRQPAGQSVLINHQVPMGNKVWGECKGL